MKRAQLQINGNTFWCAIDGNEVTFFPGDLKLESGGFQVTVDGQPRTVSQVVHPDEEAIALARERIGRKNQHRVRVRDEELEEIAKLEDMLLGMGKSVRLELE